MEKVKQIKLNMEIITILNYETGEVDIIPFKLEDDDESDEDFLIRNNHQPSNCHWMVSTDLNLKIKLK
jgi:hypothetical protein